ncbi:MAG TPA: DNA polymerase III subunit chi [Steroidobacteraceae bacterium]|nr:DNA polymerase III subunit chi [Steroidobacteraceae bacterium]
MPTVEFHILSEAGDIARMRYACQLVDAAYSQGKRIVIHVSDDNEAQKLDDMLWTFRDQAFIPHEIATAQSHEIATAQSPANARIMALIGTSVPDSFSTQLINIGTAIPAKLESLQHVIEVVDADAQRKQQARERYKQYRELGCTLETKNL